MPILNIGDLVTVNNIKRKHPFNITVPTNLDSPLEEWAEACIGHVCRVMERYPEGIEGPHYWVEGPDITLKDGTRTSRCADVDEDDISVMFVN